MSWNVTGAGRAGRSQTMLVSQPTASLAVPLYQVGDYILNIHIGNDLSDCSRRVSFTVYKPGGQFLKVFKYNYCGVALIILLHPWLVPSSGVAGIADDLIPPCCPVCLVVLFQTHFCVALIIILFYTLVVFISHDVSRCNTANIVLLLAASRPRLSETEPKWFVFETS